MTLLRVLCVLLIMSGIDDIAAGEDSALGGWWLIIVFSGLLLLTFVGGRSRAASPNTLDLEFGARDSLPQLSLLS